MKSQCLTYILAGLTLLVGPVLIVLPYGIARALSNRIVRGIDLMKQGV